MDLIDVCGYAGGRPSGRTPLKSYHFKRMIDAREGDLLDTQPPLSIEGLEKYAEGTASQVPGLEQSLQPVSLSCLTCFAAARMSNRSADE